jgi:ribosomal protein S8
MAQLPARAQNFCLPAARHATISVRCALGEVVARMAIMPSTYIEDAVRVFTEQQEKLRVELEQVQASARRIDRLPGVEKQSSEERVQDMKRVIAALGAAVSTALGEPVGTSSLAGCPAADFSDGGGGRES